ncbi:MAG: hypothetical protein IKG67_04235 [Parasporobacterium sp.]|nr:hypothetical protein [Parasporobacterium sp.]
MKKDPGRLLKSLREVRSYIRHHRFLSAAVGVFLLCVIIALIVISCSIRRSGPPVRNTVEYLEGDYWNESEQGFKYYDREGYQNEFGIDISEWVEDVDFKKLKASGISFVILRAGYRGYETGKFVPDNRLPEYLKGAKAAGLRIGAYFVSQAVSEEEAVEEAQYVLDMCKGYTLEMPVYIDLEPVYDTARTDGLNAQDYTKIALAFCKTVEEQGLRGGIYANDQWFHSKLLFDKIKQYDIWIAQYADVLSTDLPVNMWQYSSEGLVDGCDMWVDLNVRVFREQQEDIQQS